LLTLDGLAFARRRLKSRIRAGRKGPAEESAVAASA